MVDGHWHGKALGFFRVSDLGDTDAPWGHRSTRPCRSGSGSGCRPTLYVTGAGPVFAGGWLCLCLPAAEDQEAADHQDGSQSESEQNPGGHLSQTTAVRQPSWL